MLVNTMLLISRALVSSSGCGRQGDHQERNVIVPTDGERVRLHQGDKGPEATVGFLGTYQLLYEGGSWAPGMSPPAVPWPFVTFPPAHLSTGALRTPWAPKHRPWEQGLEHLCQGSGWAWECVGHRE